MSLDLDPSQIFRDFTTDGIPASGKHDPKKVEIRQHLSALRQAVIALLADADPGLTLPNLLIRAVDDGAGTPNAIQAETNLPIPVGDTTALIALNIFEENTGSPVTVSFNGGAAVTIKSNTGNDISAGGLAAGMTVLGLVSGSTFRIVTDQVSSAIVAAAEAAQAASELAADEAESYAAGLNLPAIVSGDAGKTLVVKEDESGYELGRAAAGAEVIVGLIEGDGASDADALANSQTINTVLASATGAIIIPPGLYKVAKDTSLNGYPLGDQPCILVRGKTGIHVEAYGATFWVDKHGQGILDVLRSSGTWRGGTFRGYASAGKMFPPLDGTTGRSEKSDLVGQGYYQTAIGGVLFRNNAVDTSALNSGGFGGSFPREGGGTGSTWGTWGNGGYIKNFGDGITVEDGSEDFTFRDCVAHGFNGWGFLIGNLQWREPTNSQGYLISRRVAFEACHAYNCYTGGFGGTAFDGWAVSSNCSAVGVGHPDANVASDASVDPGYGVASIRSSSGQNVIGTNMKVLESTFVNCKRKGIDAHAGTAIIVIGNYVNECGDGLHLTTAGTNSDVRYAIVSGNIIRRSGLRGFGLCASDNKAYSAGTHDGQFIISDNILVQCASTAGSRGIILVQRFGHVDVKNNNVFGVHPNRAGPIVVGIMVGLRNADAPGQVVNYVNVSGNKIYSDGGLERGVWVEQVNYATLLGNNVSLPASSGVVAGYVLQRCNNMVRAHNRAQVGSGAVSSIELVTADSNVV